MYDEETGLWTGGNEDMIEMLGTYATIYGEEELGDADMQLLQDGRDRSFEAFANGEVGMLIEGDYFWRSVVHPDPEQALFPMENRDEVVGWATIPAYEPGGALGGLDAASMSGGGVWTMNPNTEHPAEAWALLTFMNSAEQVTAGLGGQLRITARDDVNAEILTEDPLMSFMADEVLQYTTSDLDSPNTRRRRSPSRRPSSRSSPARRRRTQLPPTRLRSRRSSAPTRRRRRYRGASRYRGAADIEAPAGTDAVATTGG